MHDLLATAKFRKYILIAQTAIKDICSLQFLLQSLKKKLISFHLLTYSDSSVVLSHEPGTESMHSNELKQKKKRKRS